MVRRYSIDLGPDEEIPATDYVTHDDYQAMRRRLLVRLLRERAVVFSWQWGMQTTHAGQAACRAGREWCSRTAHAIEAGEPLTYFQSLGSDKNG